MKSVREKCLAIVASVLFCGAMVIALPGCNGDDEPADVVDEAGDAAQDTADEVEDLLDDY